MAIRIDGPVTHLIINRGKDPGSEFWFERCNHFSAMTSSGRVIVYDNGPTILRGILRIKMVAREEAEALRNLINEELRYGLKTMKIWANGYDDHGLGLGVSLWPVKLDNVLDTRSVIKSRGVGDKFDIEIPYVGMVLAGGGLGEI